MLFDYILRRLGLLFFMVLLLSIFTFSLSTPIKRFTAQQKQKISNRRPFQIY